jgi:phosphopantothenoylcysteine decarboxylase/phosphopantothenate--cysteine ligase
VSDPGRKGRQLRLLISAGPTREPIDPVRFLSNRSTGYMGAALAAEALTRGHHVTVVSGPADTPLPAGARVIPVEEALAMETAMRKESPRADAVIMAAAVADFRLARARRAKLPRQRGLTLALVPTPDIIGRLPRRRGQVVAGFAVESRAVLPRARRKLREKRLDLILAQRLDPSPALRPERSRGTQRADRATGAPFGRRPVEAWLLSRDGAVRRLGRCSKPKVARLLLDKVEALWYGQPTETKGLKKA